MFKIFVNNAEHFGLVESEVEMAIVDIFEAGELEKVGELSVSLVDDDAIAELNEQYRNKQGPTDVLSFPQDEGMQMAPPDDPEFVPLIGDVIISVPTAKRQAEEAGHTLSRELKVLLIHGILHLYGYDHDNIYQQAFMKDEEKSILLALEKIEEEEGRALSVK